MPCYHPIAAGQSKFPNPKTGKRFIVFPSSNVKFPEQFEPILLPCGNCRGCRHDQARAWAIRCVHEASIYGSNNCFITLTFDEKNINNSRTLVKSDFQDFMKRLRRRYAPLLYASCWEDEDSGKLKMEKKWIPWGVRYFHCGEYGKKFQRPHHHACLFNFDFPDKVIWKVKDGVRLYRSESLEKLWPFGWSTIGSVTFESAAYVTRYVIKKINGDMAPAHYLGRQPEYVTMSLRPGIGRKWYEEFKSTDVFPRDYIVLKGRKYRVPKYYDRCYELTNPDVFGRLKNVRMEKAKADPDNNPESRAAAERIQISYDNNVAREFEDYGSGS